MDPSRGYVNDRYGDVASARYGRLSQADVPKYARIGQGCVLGLDAQLRIARRESAEIGAIVIATKGKQRLLDGEESLGRHAQWSRAPKRLKKRTTAPDPVFAAGHDFVQVAGPSHSAKESSATQDWLGADYIGDPSGNHNKANRADDENDSDEQISEESDVQSADQALQNEIRALTRTVRQNSQDIEAWLRLASVQGRAQEVSRKETDGPTNRRRNTAIAEVQLSVLDKAVVAHRDNESNIQLRLARLHLAIVNQLWDANQINKEWTQITLTAKQTDQQTGSDIQLRYWKWQLETARTFDEALEFLTKAISELRKEIFLTVGSGRLIIEMAFIEILRHVVQYCAAASYVELVTSILQAQCELSLFSPSKTDSSSPTSFEDACTRLSSFWDSEEPRIGESEAGGFASFEQALESDRGSLRRRHAERHNKSAPFGLGSMPEGLSSADPIERFRCLDAARSNLRLFGARTSDKPDWTTGELDVDPHAFIFFDDIRRFLLPLISSDAKAALFTVAAGHLGIQCAGLSSKEWADSTTDPSVDEKFLSASLSTITNHRVQHSVDGQVMDPGASSTLADPFQQPFKSQTSPFVDELFGRLPSLQRQTWFGHWEPACIDPAKISSGTAFLEQCAHCYCPTVKSSALITRLCVAAATETPKAVNKLAKRMLSVNKDNKALWLAYAQYQRVQGQPDLARQICQNILQMELMSTEDGDDVLAQTWTVWSEIEWESGDFVATQNVIGLAARNRFGPAPGDFSSSAMPQNPLDAVQLLRTRKAYSLLFESVKNSSAFVTRSIAKSAALLEYCVAKEDEALSAACQSFEACLHHSHGDNERSPSAEQVALSYAKLIWRHASRDIPAACRSRKYSPSQVRETLHRLSNRFPTNPSFFALYAAFQMSVKFENGLRRSLETRLLSYLPDEGDLRMPDGHGLRRVKLTFLQYLYVELDMRRDFVNVSTVRSILERAISTPGLRTDRIFWQLYLQCETLHCNKLDSEVQGQGTRELTTRKSRRERDGTPDWSKEARKTATKRLREGSSRAKRVFYRAIQSCPLDKELYMKGFQAPLRRAFSIDELRGIARALDERGLRTFASLDTFLVGEQDRLALDEERNSDKEMDTEGGDA